MDWTWNLNFHRGSFLLGVATGAVTAAAVVAGSRARRRRMRRREKDGRAVVG
jgi:hypothetical protein